MILNKPIELINKFKPTFYFFALFSFRVPGSGFQTVPKTMFGYLLKKKINQKKLRWVVVLSQANGAPSRPLNVGYFQDLLCITVHVPTC